MNKKKIIIATIKSWNIENAKKFKIKNRQLFDVHIVTKKTGFTLEKVNKIKPDYIFFPHWSWIIPESIYASYCCVVFHMTDLPFGRGGSPLQNLIKRKIYKTKISALIVIKELDAGPILMKESFNLKGSAENIFRRLSILIFNKMIPDILKNNYHSQSQKGDIILFKRLKPENSKIDNNITLENLYDHIRMLDADGYPLAFLETQKLIFKFRRVQKKDNKKLTAQVIIFSKI